MFFVRYKVFNKDQLLASAPVKSIGAKGCEVSYEISKEGSLKVVVRDIVSKQVLAKIE